MAKKNEGPTVNTKLLNEILEARVDQADPVLMKMPDGRTQMFRIYYPKIAKLNEISDKCTSNVKADGSFDFDAMRNRALLTIECLRDQDGNHILSEEHEETLRDVGSADMLGKLQRCVYKAINSAGDEFLVGNEESPES